MCIPEADADLRPSLGRSGKPKEHANVRCFPARPTRGDQRLGRCEMAMSCERVDDVLPAWVLLARQVADEPVLDADGDRPRVVRVVRFGYQRRDLLDPNLLIAQSTGDITEHLLVVRGPDHGDQRVALDEALVHAVQYVRMRAGRVFNSGDSHTEGMPTRVITGGVGVVPGATMLARKLTFERELDGLRQLLMYEPRGHGAMSGAILQPPCREDADFGVIFIEVTGCLPMCGHGTIGVATVLVENGMVEVREPETIVRLDVPAGLVEARVAVEDGRATSVTLRNVAAFVHELDAEADGIRYDMAFGGNFYAIADASSAGLVVEPSHAAERIEAGLSLMAAVDEPVHPAEPDIRGCHHVIWTAPPSDGADARAATTIHPGWLDRSPCGTGTSARTAMMWARGELELGAPFVHESVIGTRFTGRLVEEVSVGGRRAVVPEITGRAWISGMGQYLLDPEDPFPEGFRVG